MLSGGDICAAADDAWEDFSLPLSPDTVNLGSTHSISKDVLLASAPDLVLASSKLSGHLELQETLDACNITAAYFDVSDFDSYLRVLKICTDITEKPERYEIYGDELKTKIDGILARNAQKPAQTVLVLRKPSLFCVHLPQAFVQRTAAAPCSAECSRISDVSILPTAKIPCLKI